jgi:hypothetical protein
VDEVVGSKRLKTLGGIVLIPQPSDDPNDPLNWSEWWKNGTMFILGLGVAVTISYELLFWSRAMLTSVGWDQ